MPEQAIKVGKGWTAGTKIQWDGRDGALQAGSTMTAALKVVCWSASSLEAGCAGTGGMCTIQLDLNFTLMVLCCTLYYQQCTAVEVQQGTNTVLSFKAAFAGKANTGFSVPHTLNS